MRHINTRHVKTVRDTSDVTLTATGDLRHRCPHFDEIDRGRIAITWRVDGRTLELHSLAEYLKSFANTRLSHEQITDHIRHELSVIAGIELLAVESTWSTAGMEVTCSTSPTPVGLP